MNINVLVLNLPNDSRPAGVRDHGRERDGQLADTFSNPDTVTPGEEVIELIPQGGAWAGKGAARAARAVTYSLAGEQRALHASSTATTYDHEGKVRYSSQDKGLRVNVTA
jgi:hypothetical protein